MPFFYGYDPTFVILIPALILALYAQARVQSTFERYSRVAASSGLTGAQVARRILSGAGLDDVAVERVPGRLTDHYDPRGRVLRLSAPVHDSPSLSALGVAAHEAGHAIQHGIGFLPLRIRNQIVPVANLGSQGGPILFLLGLFLGSPFLQDLGIYFFGAAVAFYLITLPVEYNASGRALALLEGGGYLTRQEVVHARRVLDAAALTYVAAALMAVLQLARLLLLRSQREE